MKKIFKEQLKGHCGIPGAILLLPFLVFYWFVPFLGHLTIGMDYPMFSIFTQMELQFSIKNGSFPLYVPRPASGSPAPGLTLGQMFHPISHLAALLPGYWTGKALEWNTFLRLFSLGLTHLVLFYFLRKLKLRVDISLILSFITVYNLRMLDNFRYGAALENYTAFLFLCVAIGGYYLKPSKFLGPLWIIGSTYLLAVGGHPQMMYYGLFGVALVTLVLPEFLSAVLPETKAFSLKIWKYYLHIVGFCTTGVLLASAYFFPFYFDFVIGHPRTTKPFSWASDYTDTFIGTLNNFFRPFYSDVHGSFGGSPLIVISAIIPLLLCFKIKIPRIIWGIWILFLLIFLYMQGSRLPVQYLVWEYFPLASIFRIPGRIAIILPFMILLLLVWLMKQEKAPIKVLKRDYFIYPYVLLSVLAFILFFLYHLILTPMFPGASEYSPANINEIPSWVEFTTFWLGACSITILIFYNSNQKGRSITGSILFLVIFVQMVMVLRYGTWITEKQVMPSFSQMKAQKVAQLAYLGPLPWLRTISVQRLPLARIYWDYAPAFSAEKDSPSVPEQEKKNGLNMEPPLIVENDAPLEDFNLLNDGKTKGRGGLILEYSSFNRVRFSFFSSRPGFFVLFYPYSKNWGAYVNLKNSPLFKANDRYQAVWIPAGEGKIEFLYWSSAAFWGMVVTCATLFLGALYFLVKPLSGYVKWVGIFFSMVLGLGLFMWWYFSLYSGDNLETRYIWKSKTLETNEPIE